MPGSFPDARFVLVIDALLGPQNHDIDGAETIWAFFKTHTLLVMLGAARRAPCKT